jgi:hypothetical protein
MAARTTAFPIACLLLCLVFPTAAPARADAAQQAAACTSSVGPGIPPPPTIPSGIPGFHAAWYGQSGYPTLCPGERSTATVAYYNSGSVGWVRGRLGEMAFLGTWDPSPGQDRASALGGDGTAGSPATGWPRYNRIAAQPADYVGPGQVAWFQFAIQAPTTAGTYFLYLRPLIEGATWMEDYGVFWQVTVKQSDTVGAIAVGPATTATVESGGNRSYTATLSGTGCVDLALIDESSYPASFEGGLADADLNGKADLSSAALFTVVNGAGKGTSYVDCVTPAADQTLTFFVSSTTPNTSVRPVVFRDDNGNNAIDVNGAYQPSEPLDLGGIVRFVPPEATTGAHTANVLLVSTTEDYFTDTAGTATYRYDSNDTFRRSSVAINLAQFEELLSRGDSVSVSYQATDADASTFTITNDVGREAPTVDAVLDSWDGGATQNDVGLLIAEPPTNVDGIAYSIQRSQTGGVAVCTPGTGAYADLALTVITKGSDTTTYVDRNLAVGAYCYRVGATDPLTGITAYGYSNGVTVNNPPLAAAPPRSVDARVTTSAGSPSLLDVGDAIKIAFSKPMQTPVSRQLRVRDSDGTIADIRCLQAEQACTLNAGPESIGGVAYPANAVITITFRTQPSLVAAGSTPGLQLNVTATSGSFADVAGNTWDLGASDDVILGAPD